MTDQEQAPNGPALDGAITARFAELRAAESASAPALPGESAAQVKVFPARQRAWRGDVPRIAAAIAAVAVTAALLYEPAAEDPASLYTIIMGENEMQTDSLLFVSDSVLPAQSTVPHLYDIDIEFDAETYTNEAPNLEDSI